MTLMFFGTALATCGVALVISAVLNNITTRAIYGSIFVALGLTLACGSARADSIEAEEIEVPAPEWSVFHEAPAFDPPFVSFEPLPPEIDEESGPPVVPPPPTESGPPGPPPIVALLPIPLCWLPFVSCSGGDGGPPRFVPPGPPSSPPTAPVPEPGAALLFAVGLGAIASRCKGAEQEGSSR